MISRFISISLAVLLGGFPVSGQEKSRSADQFCTPRNAACFPDYDAYYVGPTTLYRHGVLGDEIEWSGLVLKGPTQDDTFLIGITDEVFEDVAPRLADFDGDGVPEAVVVQSHPDMGAQLAIYSRAGKIAATPYIGTSFRWLAPIGIADFNGDGSLDVAYVDRPHLAKTLRVWTYSDRSLTEIASLKGVTNHRIGHDYITGGVRSCGDGPKMVLVDANWENIISVGFANGRLKHKNLAPFTGKASVSAALGCN